MTQAFLGRIADALDRISPAPLALPDFDAAQVFVWQADPDGLVPVPQVNRVCVELLVGVDSARDTLLANSVQFAKGLPANNALLWGARGMGKSSLVKAVHGALLDDYPRLKLVEVQREDLPSIGRCLALLRDVNAQFIWGLYT